MPDREGKRVTAVHWAIFGLGGVELLAVAVWRWRTPVDAMEVLGLLLAVAGYGLVGVARAQLGSAFAARARAGDHLVTTGLYARVRNPIYVASTLLVAGVCLLLHFAWALLLLIPVVGMQSWRARREAEVLRERFGEEYEAYRERTWF